MKKINPVVWAVLAVPVIYMAMVLACSYEAGTDLFALMERFGLLLGRPDLLRWTAYTPRFLLVFLLLYGGGVFLYYADHENRRPGEEYGSAKWGNARELNKRYADQNGKNVILTKRVSIGLDGYKHRRNLNILVVGGSGSGKTRFFCKPGIMSVNCSYLDMTNHVQNYPAAANAYATALKGLRTATADSAGPLLKNLKDAIAEYRKKKTAFLDESEWVSYPDPNIPAIVSEEVWDKANALFKQRSARSKAYGVGYQSRYPYSGKIICGKHGTSFHRQSFKTQEGETEFWKCKMYREHGKAGCDLPTIRTTELDTILAEQFQKLVKHQRQIIRMVLDSVTNTQKKEDHSKEIARLQAQIQQLEDKKEKLLELSMADAITMQEFKKRNSRFNEQITALQTQTISLQQQEQQKQIAATDTAALEKALWADLNCKEPIQSEVVATILDHAVVCEDSDDKQIHLELYLRLGQTASAYYERGKLAFKDVSSRSITRSPLTRRT